MKKENNKDLVKNLGILGLGISSNVNFNFMSPEDKLKELNASALMVAPHMHKKNEVNSPNNKIPTEEEIFQMLKEAESTQANDSKLVSKEELLEILQVESSKGGDYTNIINQIKSIRVDVKPESTNDKNKSLK